MPRSLTERYSTVLEGVKAYINELPDQSFAEFYEQYVCRVQDMNLMAEVNSVKTSDILSLDKLIAKLYKELL